MFGNNNKNPLTDLREMYTNQDENADNTVPTNTPEEPIDTPEEPIDTPEEPIDTPEEPADITEQTESTQVKDIANQYLTSSNMFLLIWFLAIYIVVYYILGTFFNKGK